MSEFSDRPFVAGSVFGLRSFRIYGHRSEPDQRLGGVAREAVWEPGLNQAACLKAGSYLWMVLAGPLPAEVDHQVASKDCTCGYYAYFGSTDGYAQPDHGTVTGIIEGSGVVTIGSKGFRAEKARIVALVRPDWPAHFCPCTAEFMVTPPDFAAVQRSYPDVPTYDTVQEALAAHPTTKPEDVGIDPNQTDETEWMGRLFAVPIPLQAQAAPTAQMINWGQMIGSIRMAPTSQPLDFGQLIAKGMEQIAAGVQTAIVKLGSFQLTIKHDAGQPNDPVANMRAAREAAAQARQKAGLNGTGGINRQATQPWRPTPMIGQAWVVLYGCGCTDAQEHAGDLDDVCPEHSRPPVELEGNTNPAQMTGELLAFGHQCPLPAEYEAVLT